MRLRDVRAVKIVVEVQVPECRKQCHVQYTDKSLLSVPPVRQIEFGNWSEIVLVCFWSVLQGLCLGIESLDIFLLGLVVCDINGGRWGSMGYTSETSALCRFQGIIVELGLLGCHFDDSNTGWCDVADRDMRGYINSALRDD